MRLFSPSPNETLIPPTRTLLVALAFHGFFQSNKFTRLSSISEVLYPLFSRAKFSEAGRFRGAVVFQDDFSLFPPTQGGGVGLFVRFDPLFGDASFP